MTEQDLKSLQTEAKRLATALDAVARVKLRSNSFLEDMKKALNRLPDPTEATETIERIRAQGTAFLTAEAEARASAFRSHEAAFVQNLRDQGTAYRELNASWRVGPLEVEVRRESSQARTCYNHDPVLPWTNIADPDDLKTLYERSLAALDKSEIAEAELAGLIGRAFDDAFHHNAPTASAARRVPIHALLRSIRIERLRQELAAGSPGKTVRAHEMPMWSLLYNLDRYRQLAARDSLTPRIQFETGSQQEQAQGKSVTLNGLNATQDYQAYAHAVQRG